MLGRVYEFIDDYPDMATFSVILLASIAQTAIGNRIDVLIISTSLMLPTMLLTLPTNVLMKRTFGIRRPRRYYEVVRSRNTFEESFPSFHAQFSAGEATTFIFGIYYFSPKEIRFLATLLAIAMAGFASILIAYSRIAVGVHHGRDVVGWFLFGVVTGYLVSTCFASFWRRIPLEYHAVTIVVFVLLVFTLSEKQRKIKINPT